jgi:hypothetical protein
MEFEKQIRDIISSHISNEDCVSVKFHHDEVQILIGMKFELLVIEHQNISRTDIIAMFYETEENRIAMWKEIETIVTQRTDLKFCIPKTIGFIEHPQILLNENTFSAFENGMGWHYFETEENIKLIDT